MEFTRAEKARIHARTVSEEKAQAWEMAAEWLVGVLRQCQRQRPVDVLPSHVEEHMASVIVPFLRRKAEIIRGDRNGGRG